MTTSKFIVDGKLKRVKATTDNAVFQLHNESIVNSNDVKKWPMKKNIWYPINGSYGIWVINNEFPTFKGNEFINVEYIN